MNAEANALRARNLRTLALLAALFLAPLLLAFFTYYGTDWRPAAHVNHGTLIEPPRRLPAVRLPAADGQGAAEPVLLAGKWTLLYAGDGACAAECRQALWLMRQTRLLLNNDMTRVRRVFLASVHCCAREFLAREHPGLVTLDAEGADGAALVGELPGERAYSVYVIDPLGNLMMRYDAREDPRGLLKDLSKLLRLSHIG